MFFMMVCFEVFYFEFTIILPPPTGGGLVQRLVYEIVWHFEALNCQTVAMFNKCTALKISTFRQMFYIPCYQLAFIHFQSISYQFCSTLCVRTDTLFDKFWSCVWLFERLGNVCGCEALAISII